jgi:two-component system, sensor histidine kinase
MSRPPRAPRDGGGPHPEAASAAQRPAAHVLLVEDDAAVRDATRLLLKVEGYRVTAVASLAEALQAVQAEGAPDLLLTDYYLRNGETGLTVLGALRAQLAALPAVVMTGDPGPLAAQAAHDPRLRIAAKPLKRAPLLGAIETLLPR